jgi:DeoR family transcriptional regulator, fructose operon transcriptional repressor
MPSDTRPGVSASARFERLLDTLATEGKISSRDAAHQLGCSLETIRKDLLILESQGLLRRAHGGALPVHTIAHEIPLDERTDYAAQKKRIATSVLQELRDGTTLFLESGSTTEQVAVLIPDTLRLTVFTHSLPIARALVMKPLIETHFIGGAIRPLTHATAGYWALRELSDLRVDIAVLGTNAISSLGELSTPDSDEAAIKAAALTVATKTILVADHSKFGNRAVFHYGNVSDIDLLVTDTSSRTALSALTNSQPRTYRFV